MEHPHRKRDRSSGDGRKQGPTKLWIVMGLDPLERVV